MSIELTPREVIEKYLNELVTGLEIEGALQTDGNFATISTVSLLMSLHKQCRDLRRLSISNLTLEGRWQTFATPWTHLRRLEITDVPVQCDKFELKTLHLDFPHLEEFIWVCSNADLLGPDLEPRSVPQWLTWHREKHTKGQGPGPGLPDLSKCENLHTVKLCFWIVRGVLTQPAHLSVSWLKKHLPPGLNLTWPDLYRKVTLVWNRENN